MLCIRPASLYGNVFLTIPAGTQSGEKLRLRSKGISNVNDLQKESINYVNKKYNTKKL